MAFSIGLDGYTFGFLAIPLAEWVDPNVHLTDLLIQYLLWASLGIKPVTGHFATENSNLT